MFKIAGGVAPLMISVAAAVSAGPAAAFPPDVEAAVKEALAKPGAEDAAIRHFGEDTVFGECSAVAAKAELDYGSGHLDDPQQLVAYTIMRDAIALVRRAKLMDGFSAATLDALTADGASRLDQDLATYQSSRLYSKCTNRTISLVQALS